MINLDINNFIVIITFLGSITVLIGFKWKYDAKIKAAATMEDVKESEARCMKSDQGLEKRMDKIESNLKDDINYVHKSLDRIEHNQSEMMKMLIDHIER